MFTQYHKYNWSHISSLHYCSPKKCVYLLLRHKYSTYFLTFMNLTSHLITTAKSNIQHLEGRPYKIEGTYIYSTLIHLYASIECAFNTVWKSSFLILIHVT